MIKLRKTKCKWCGRVISAVLIGKAWKCECEHCYDVYEVASEIQAVDEFFANLEFSDLKDKLREAGHTEVANG